MSFYTDDSNDVTGSHARLKADVARLEAEVERLRAALRPFAAYADAMPDNWGDDAVVDWAAGEPALTLGDCRRARAALGEGRP